MVSPPERPSPGEYDPSAYDIDLDMSPGCIYEIGLYEMYVRDAVMLLR